jgi:hypothetical protein
VDFSNAGTTLGSGPLLTFKNTAFANSAVTQEQKDIEFMQAILVKYILQELQIMVHIIYNVMVQVYGVLVLM